MRKIAATYLFTPQAQLQKNTILICENDGTVVDLVHKNEPLSEEAGLEFYSGILVPGFVNTFCRIAEQHDSNAMPTQASSATSLAGGQQEKQKALIAADRKMWSSGIAAAADISFSAQTTDRKQKSKIKYLMFVAVSGVARSDADTAAEFIVGTGTQPNPPTQNTPVLQLPGSASQTALLTPVSHQTPLLLVLRDDFPEQELARLLFRRSPENTFFVVCTNAGLNSASNLLGTLRKHRFLFCFGTGISASSRPHSVLEEIKTMHRYFPEIQLEDLLAAACINGARALGIGHTFGSFETGKKPGVTLLSGLDLKQLKPGPQTRAKRLL